MAPTGVIGCRVGNYWLELPQQQVVQVQVQAAENSDSGAMVMESTSCVLLISMCRLCIIFSLIFIFGRYRSQHEANRCASLCMRVASRGETGLGDAENANRNGMGGYQVWDAGRVLHYPK